MVTRDVSTLRGAIEHFRAQKQLLVVTNEVDTIYEIAAIEKALEGGLMG